MFVLVVAFVIIRPLDQVALSATLFDLLTLSTPLIQQDRAQERAAEKPSRNFALRIKLLIGDTQEVTFDSTILAETVLDTNIISTQRKGDDQVIITGLARGETILIVSGETSRRTYVIQVLPRPRIIRTNRYAQPKEQAGSISGFFGTTFSPGFDGSPSQLRNDFELNQKLSGSRTLRASAEMFHIFGKGERALLAQSLGTNLGINRVKLGVDSPNSRLEFIDSDLDISRLSFNHYTMRGPHFVSTSESRWRGLELFAGRARPQLSFFNEGEGLLGGALIPVAQGTSWRLRAGAFFISPQGNSAGQERGVVWHGDLRFAPNEKTTAEAELDYSNGSVSWRTRLALRRGPFNFYSELLRVTQSSPLVSLGAQSSGRKMNEIGFEWRPKPRFSVSFGYHDRTNFPSLSSRRVGLDSRTITVSTGYVPTRGTRFGFSFNRQELEQSHSTSLPALLKLQTSATTFKYSQRVSSHWLNDFETRLIFSGEDSTSVQMTRGFSLREQLRFTLRRGSLTGFFNYRSNTPTLTGLVIRNPMLLPVGLRAAFKADPVRFLLTNRNALPELLPEIELPVSRSTEAGLRLQAAFSKLNVAGEVRYNAGEIQARTDHNLIASLNAGLKLDAANSIQLSGAHAVSFGGAGNRTLFTLSFVHRFGVPGGRSVQLSRMFGFGRGSLQGRVFFDLNCNGQDDPEEPGVPGIKVQLDGDSFIMTDSQGFFRFGGLESGGHNVELNSRELGVTLRSSNTTQRQLLISSRKTTNVSFGVTNFGFVQGRIFNDLSLSGEAAAGEAPGVEGVRVLLRSTSKGSTAAQPLSMTVTASGNYEFRNLPPGNYILEIDPASIPADFRLPGQSAWPINVNPLTGSYLDLPVNAQRAVSGFVYIDRDGNGQFDSKIDEVVKGARVTGGQIEARTDQHGAYLMRNLPAGEIEVFASTIDGKKSNATYIRLGSGPAYRKNQNLAISQ